MTRNSYLAMTVTAAVERNPECNLETAYLKATIAADFLEAKKIAPWQEPVTFRVPADEIQRQQAQQGRPPEVLQDPPLS